MSITEIPLVTTYRAAIDTALQHLSHEQKSKENDVEILSPLHDIRSHDESPEDGPAHNAAVETVLREKFIDLLATHGIDSLEFEQVWTLLDAINSFSDYGLCDAGLPFYLIEELLDSQTIDGCRKVFDYLESRRERMIQKNFKSKNLVILRCCNELLRRLSRAEDTVFCGRVFIYMFQSFPLGDKSSVNLRGEFHAENVTTYDEVPEKSENAIKPMEIDTDGLTAVTTSGAQTPSSVAQDLDQKTARSTPRPTKADTKSEPPPDLDVLYPQFWSLQSLFSAPTRLFEAQHMQKFKDGISATMSCFKYVAHSSAPSNTPTESKRGLKRKRIDGDPDEIAATTSTFNPKYLTNRDLFDLEIQDIAFRRHILVQALILIDFLLSLSPTAKSKMTDLTNKSVLYSFTLSEDDTKWAQSTRQSIASYLQQGNGTEGKFYYRMVDTVLSRDKNWARWKAENCPSISRPPIDVRTYMEAQKSLQEKCSSAPLPLPPGANELAFLSRSESIDELQHPSRRKKMPDLADYYKMIQGDELDLEMAMDNDDKTEIEEKKAGKVWRALRAAHGRRFVLCEQIKNGENLAALIGNNQNQVNGNHDNDADAGADGNADADGETEKAHVTESHGDMELEQDGNEEEPSAAADAAVPIEEQEATQGEEG